MANIIGKKATVVLIVAKTFLKYHGKSGEPTDFGNKIQSGEKIHTIRSNFKEWEKKIRKIQEGDATLSVRQWLGVPYRSAQVKLFEFDDVSIQKLEFIDGKFIVDGEREVKIGELAKNDGLTVQDFKDWFKVFPTTPMAVIHWTKFKY